MARRRIGHRYGRRHKEIRRHFMRRMAAGEVFRCWRCGKLISGKWDLGHTDSGLGVSGRWPEHTWCNRQTVTHLKEKLAKAEGKA